MSISSLSTLAKEAVANAIISSTRAALLSHSFALQCDLVTAESIFQRIKENIESLRICDLLPQQQRSIWKRISLRAPDIAFLVAVPFSSFYPIICTGYCPSLYLGQQNVSISYPSLVPYFAQRFPETLQELDLGGMEIFDDVLIALASSPASKSLKRIKISGSLSGACRSSWAACTALEHLSLNFDLNLFESNFDEILRLPQLRSIDLSACNLKHVSMKPCATRIVHKIFSVPHLEKIQLPSVGQYNKHVEVAAEWVELLERRPAEQNALITLFTIGMASDDTKDDKTVHVIEKIYSILGPLETSPAFNIALEGVLHARTVESLAKTLPPEKWRLVSSLKIDGMKPSSVRPVLQTLSDNCPEIKHLTLTTATHASGGYCTNMTDFGPLLPQSLESFSASFSPNKISDKPSDLPQLMTCFPPRLKTLYLHVTYSPPVILFEDEESANSVVASILRDCPQLKQLSLINYVLLSQFNVDTLMAGLPRLTKFEFTSNVAATLPSSAKLRHVALVSKNRSLNLVGSFPAYEKATEQIGAPSSQPEDRFFRPNAEEASVEIGVSTEDRMAIASRNIATLQRRRGLADLTLLFEEMIPKDKIAVDSRHEYQSMIDALSQLPFASTLQHLHVTTERPVFPSRNTGSTFPLSSLVCFSNITSLKMASTMATDEVMSELLAGLPFLAHLDVRGGTFRSLDWVRHQHLRCITMYWGWPAFSEPLRCTLTQEHLPSISRIRFAYSASTREDQSLSWTFENLPRLEHLSVGVRVTFEKPVCSVSILSCPKLLKATLNDAGLILFKMEQVPSLHTLAFRCVFGGEKTEVSIDAPNLEYLSLSAGGRFEDADDNQFSALVRESCKNQISSGKCTNVEYD